PGNDLRVLMSGPVEVATMPLFGRKKDKEYQEAARLLSEGQAEEASEKLREFLDKHPNDTNAMVSLAVALIQIQKRPALDSPSTQEALILLDQAADLNPRDPVAIFNKGVCQRTLGLLADALESFEAALEVEDRLPLAILHMAEINYELENWEKAVELARLALVRDPGIEGALTWVPDAMKNAGYMDEEGNVVNTPWEEENPDG
ncbi:MAG: tetratricopeptide repeat protein, partial [Promethearchaeota archaeon]